MQTNMVLHPAASITMNRKLVRRARSWALAQAYWMGSEVRPCNLSALSPRGGQRTSSFKVTDLSSYLVKAREFLPCSWDNYFFFMYVQPYLVICGHLSTIIYSQYCLRNACVLCIYSIVINHLTSFGISLPLTKKFTLTDWFQYIGAMFWISLIVVTFT